MKIKNIKIENFRAIQSLSVKTTISDGMLLFGGRNGSGKTSALEAIMWALGNTLREQTRGPLPKQDYLVELSGNDLNGEDWTVKSSRAGTVDVPQNGGGPAALHKQGRTVLNSASAFYFSSWRIPKRVGPVGLTLGKKGKRPQQKDFNALWNLKQSLVNFQGAVGFGSDVWREARVKELFENLNRTWSRFYPDGHEKFHAEICNAGASAVHEPAPDEELGFDVFLSRQSVESPIPIDDLSSGEIELLCFIGTILLEKYRRNRPFDFVFLDEPELHLNRAWHRLLVPVLHEISPQTQYFIATHSEDVWNSVYDEQRVLLKGGRA